MNEDNKQLWPEPSKGFCDLYENLILAYGIPKIGKTTFGSQFPKALFLTTEDGTKHVVVEQWRIRSWLEFLSKVKVLEDNIATCPYQTIIIDTVANLTEMCEEFISHKMGVSGIAEVDYGKGYAAYEKELRKQINRLVKLGFGVVFIAHAEEKTVSIDSVVSPYAPMLANDKGELTMMVPSLDKRARKFVVGLVDMIFYMEIDRNQNRVIHTKPTKHFESGDRSGRLPATLPLNYDALVNAYYGSATSEDGEAKKNLIDRINKAEQFMAQHKIDNFDQPVRVQNSRKKHLDSDNGLENASLPKLEEYLQHLRMKAKAHKKEKADG